MKENDQPLRNYSIDDLNDIVEAIKNAENLTEEGIALQMGYNIGYISQVRSRGEVSVKFIDALKREFRAPLQKAKYPHMGIAPTQSAKNAHQADLPIVLEEILANLADLKNGQSQLWNQGQMVRQDIAGVSDYMMLKDAEWDQDKLKALRDTYYKIVRAGPGERL